MTTAPRSFRRAVAKKAGLERPVTTFTLESVSDEGVEEGGEPVVTRSDTFHATRPTDERLFMLAALAGADEEDGAGEAAATMELLKSMLPVGEFKILKERLLDPDDDVTIEMLGDVLEWLMEQWSSFPTQEPSGSSTSPQSTGAGSTGRVRGPGSTR